MMVLLAFKAAKDAYTSLLQLYQNESNLFFDARKDDVGFNNAVQHRYHGYMGPWLEDDALSALL